MSVTIRTETAVPRRASVATVLTPYLQRQIAAIEDVEASARVDGPDAVHQMRVATRRLRAALRAYRRYLHRDVTDPLRAELGWLGGALGSARDCEVIEERLLALVAEAPPEPALRAAEPVLRAALAARRAEAVAVAAVDLDSARYAALRASLDELRRSPPLRARAQRRARTELPQLLRRARRRVRRAAERAEDIPPGAERDLAWHEVRRAAKRARYVGESAAPALGAPARRLAGVMEELQELLGQVHDASVTGAVLAGLAGAETGEVAYGLGLLTGLDRARAEVIGADYPDLVAAATSGKLLRPLPG